MFNNRIVDILTNVMATEWHGFNNGDKMEETVTFANGCELEMTLLFPETEEEETDEEEIDYVLVGGNEQNPVLCHKDVVDVYLECLDDDKNSQEKMKEKEE